MRSLLLFITFTFLILLKTAMADSFVVVEQESPLTPAVLQHVDARCPTIGRDQAVAVLGGAAILGDPEQGIGEAPAGTSLTASHPLWNNWERVGWKASANYNAPADDPALSWKLVVWAVCRLPVQRPEIDIPIMGISE